MPHTTNCLEHFDCKRLLAEYVQQRRQQLELTVSEIAGIAFSKWCALDLGGFRKSIGYSTALPRHC
jgi:hypothetical protein